MTLYPVFLRLAGKPVLLVGGGGVAAAKLDGLVAAGATVTVVAPDVLPDIAAAAAVVHRRAFQASDVDGMWWVVAAAPAEINRQVQAAAEARHIFVNAVDDPAHATAYLGGVVRRGDVAIAISTGGRAPALAGLLREAFESWLPQDLDAWMAAADGARHEWKQRGVPMEQRRPLLLDALNRLYEGKK